MINKKKCSVTVYDKIKILKTKFKKGLETSQEYNKKECLHKTGKKINTCKAFDNIRESLGSVSLIRIGTHIMPPGAGCSAGAAVMFCSGAKGAGFSALAWGTVAAG
ncbi:hypothetical protein GQX74_007139 [Glossina fuscipes]|uniref:Uncharacterized protein n=1 Tax=Glossina palpalis gambiensis TaxID=67801 RepID=A0A1B0ALS1_9MUSC|nr:hypothetical protein GQX74_007139 [Glossina fuscipes]